MARELKNYTNQIRLVSRNPKKVNDSDELYHANLANPVEIDGAIAGSEVVYVTVGFEYNLKIWKAVWPPFVEAVVASCLKHQCKLVFFDNMYLYAKSEVPFMTESSIIGAPSEKGKVREKLHRMIMDAVEQKSLNALIARAADFYGPENNSSALTMMVAQNLMKGKKAMAFGDVDKIHTYTYTPDAAKATAMLGNTPDAYNQVWHVPTTREKWTTRRWIEQIARELDTENHVLPLQKWLVRIMGWFIPVMREFPEMFYQYEQDYVLDSSKFEKRFGIIATAPEEGIRKTIEFLKSSSR